MSGFDRFQPQLRESDAGWKHAGVHRSHRATDHHLQGAAGGGERPHARAHARALAFISQALLQNMRTSLASVSRLDTKNIPNKDPCFFFSSTFL